MLRKIYLSGLNASLKASLKTFVGLAIMATTLECSNKGEVSKKDSLKEATHFLIAPMEGDSQAVPPRSAFKPISFKITDKNKKPVTGARVEWRLMDATNLKELTLERVNEAFKKGEKYLNPEEAPSNLKLNEGKQNEDTIDEDFIGRITNVTNGRINAASATAAQGSSDDRGVTQVDLFAPAYFGRELVVALSVAQTEKIGGAFAFVKLKTQQPGEAAVFKITTTKLNKESTDNLFDIIITARDSTDRRSFQFEQKLGLKVTSNAKGVISWGGKVSEMPEGTYECEFLAGQCTLPGGPYQISKPGDFSIDVEVPSGLMPKSVGLVSVAPGKPDRLVAASGLGEAQGVAMYPNGISMRQNSSMPLAVALIDKSGNVLGNPKAPVFKTSKDPFEIKPSGAGGLFSFEALGTSPTGESLLSFVDSESGKEGQLFFKVLTRGATKFLVSTPDFLNDRVAERKVGCFDFSIKAVDDSNEEDENFSRTVDIAMSVSEGAVTGSHIQLAKLRLNNETGAEIANGQRVPLEFRKGRATSPVVACFYNGSSLSPSLSLSGAVDTAFLEATHTFKLIKDVPFKVMLSTTPVASTPGANISDMCQTNDLCFTVRDTDAPLQVYPYLSDIFGNTLRPGASKWEYPGANLNLTSGVSGAGGVWVSNVASNQPQVMQANGQTSSPANVDVTIEGTRSTFVVSVVSATFHSVWVQTEKYNANSIPSEQVTAGECVFFSLEARYSSGSRNFNAGTSVSPLPINITIGLSGADGPANLSNKPKFLVNGQLQNGPITETVSFIEGRGYPKAKACLFDSSATTAKITVSASLGVAGTDLTRTGESQAIRVLKGLPTALKLTNALPADPTSPIAYVTSVCVAAAGICLQKTTDNPNLNLYAVQVDGYGNFVHANESTSWSLGGELADDAANNCGAGALGQCTKPYGSPLQLNFNAPDVSTINVTLGGVSSVFNYQVSPGAPKSFTVSSANSNSEVAGAEFALRVALYDGKNNLASNYSGNQNATFVLKQSNQSAPSSSLTGVPPVSSVTENLSFIGGRATSVGKLKAVRTGESLVVESALAGVSATSLSTPVTLLPGPLASIKLRQSPLGLGLDTFPSVISINTPLNLFVAGYDSLQNYVRDVASDFSFVQFPLLSPNPSLWLTSTTNSSATSFSSNLIDTGKIKATAVENASWTAETTTFSTQAKPASKFLVFSEHNNTATSGEPFSVKVRAVDSDNNLDAAFTHQIGLELNFTSNRSWGNQDPFIPSVALNGTNRFYCQFTLGECDLRSIKLPGTLVSAGFDGGFKLVDASALSILNVREVQISGTDPAVKVNGVYTTFIVVNAGPASQVRLTKIQGGGMDPNKIGWPLQSTATPYALNQTLSFSRGNPIEFHAVSTDAGGNYLADLSASWSSNSSKITSAMSLVSPNSHASLSPTQSIYGSDNASLQAQSGALTSASVYLIVKDATQFVLKDPNFLGLISGTQKDVGCFPFGIEAADALGNRNDAFNEVMQVQFSILEGSKQGVHIPQASFRFGSATGSVVYSGQSVNVEFIQGRAPSPLWACFYNGSASTPKVDLSGVNALGTTMASDASFTLRKANASNLHLTSDALPSGGSITNVEQICTDKTNCKTLFDSDPNLILRPVYLDTYGNYVGNAASTWTLPTWLNHSGASLASGSAQTFSVLAAGQGNIGVQMGAFTENFYFKARTRNVDKFLVRTEKYNAAASPTESLNAGQCVALQVLAAFSDNTPNSTFGFGTPETLTVTFTLDSADGPANLSTRAKFQRAGLAPNAITSTETLTFVDGVANAITKACLFDASATVAKVSASSLIGASTKSGITDVLQVSKGQEASFVLTSAAPPDPSNLQSYVTNACGNLFNALLPCISTNADVNNVPLYVAKTDSYGNYLGPIASTWQFVGTTFAANATTSCAPGTATTGACSIASGVSQTLHPQVVTPVGSNASVNVAAFVNGASLVQTFSIAVAPGVPNKMVPSLNLVGGLKAGQLINPKVEFKDRFDNVCTNFNATRNLEFKLVKEVAGVASSTLISNSPNGTAPVATLTLSNMAITEGVAQASGGQVLKAVNTSEKLYLVAMESGLGAYTTPTYTTVLPDVAASLKLRSATDGAGSVITTATLQVSEIFNLFVAGEDSFGNFVGNVSSDITYSIVSGATPTIHPVSPSANTSTVTFSSDVLGIYKVTATSLASSLSPAGLTVQTGNLSVASRSAVKYVVKVFQGGTRTNTPTAGADLSITIEAQDNFNNIDTGYVGAKTVALTSSSLVSYGGESPVLPSNTSHSCTFVAGVCSLGSGFKVMDVSALSYINATEMSVGTVGGPWAVALAPVKGTPSQIRFSSTWTGGSENPAKLGWPLTATGTRYSATTNLTITTDETLEFYAVITDAAGNYISDASPSFSSGPAQLTSDLISLQSGVGRRYDPSRPVLAGESGFVEAAQSGKTSARINLVTNVGAPAKLKTYFKHDDTGVVQSVLTAGECYLMETHITDLDGNTYLFSTSGGAMVTVGFSVNTGLAAGGGESFAGINPPIIDGFYHRTTPTGRPGHTKMYLNRVNGRSHQLPSFGHSATYTAGYLDAGMTTSYFAEVANGIIQGTPNYLCGSATSLVKVSSQVIPQSYLGQLPPMLSGLENFSWLRSTEKHTIGFRVLSGKSGSQNSDAAGHRADQYSCRKIDESSFTSSIFGGPSQGPNWNPGLSGLGASTFASYHFPNPLVERVARGETVLPESCLNAFSSDEPVVLKPIYLNKSGDEVGLAWGTVTNLSRFYNNDFILDGINKTITFTGNSAGVGGNAAPALGNESSLQFTDDTLGISQRLGVYFVPGKALNVELSMVSTSNVDKFGGAQEGQLYVKFKDILGQETRCVSNGQGCLAAQISLSTTPGNAPNGLTPMHPALDTPLTITQNILDPLYHKWFVKSSNLNGLFRFPKSGELITLTLTIPGWDDPLIPGNPAQRVATLTLSTKASTPVSMNLREGPTLASALASSLSNTMTAGDVRRLYLVGQDSVENPMTIPFDVVPNGVFVAQPNRPPQIQTDTLKYWVELRPTQVGTGGITLDVDPNKTIFLSAPPIVVPTITVVHASLAEYKVDLYRPDGTHPGYLSLNGNLRPILTVGNHYEIRITGVDRFSNVVTSLNGSKPLWLQFPYTNIADKDRSETGAVNVLSHPYGTGGSYSLIFENGVARRMASDNLPLTLSVYRTQNALDSYPYDGLALNVPAITLFDQEGGGGVTGGQNLHLMPGPKAGYLASCERGVANELTYVATGAFGNVAGTMYCFIYQVDSYGNRALGDAENVTLHFEDPQNGGQLMCSDGVPCGTGTRWDDRATSQDPYPNQTPWGMGESQSLTFFPANKAVRKIWVNWDVGINIRALIKNQAGVPQCLTGSYLLFGDVIGYNTCREFNVLSDYSSVVSSTFGFKGALAGGSQEYAGEEITGMVKLYGKYGNLLKNVSGMNLVTLTQLTGLETSPSGLAPELPTETFAFSEGVARFELRTYKSQTIGAGASTLTLSFATPGQYGGVIRTYTNQNAFTVMPGQNSISTTTTDIASTPPSRLAENSSGGTFRFTIELKDIYGNLKPLGPATYWYLKTEFTNPTGFNPTDLGTDHNVRFASDNSSWSIPYNFLSTGTYTSPLVYVPYGSADLQLYFYWDTYPNGPTLTINKTPVIQIQGTNQSLDAFEIYVTKQPGFEQPNNDVLVGPNNVKFKVTPIVKMGDQNSDTIPVFEPSLLTALNTAVANGALTWEYDVPFSPNFQASVPPSSSTPFSLQLVNGFKERLFFESLASIYTAGSYSGEKICVKLTPGPHWNGKLIRTCLDNDNTGGTKNLVAVPGSVSTLKHSASSGTISAGSSTNVTTTMSDTYGNGTKFGCQTGVLSAYVDAANYTAPDGVSQPMISGSVRSAGSPFTADISSAGTFAIPTVALYKTGTNPLNISVNCGGNVFNDTFSLSVVQADPAYVVTTTSDVRPAYNASHVTEVACNNTSSANSSTSCGALYAWVWDSYRNTSGSGSGESCTWSFSNKTLSTVSGVSGSSHSYQLTHSDFVDGDLICTAGGIAKSALMWGGTYGFDATLASAYSYPLVANSNNWMITYYDVTTRKNGATIAKPNPAGGQTIVWTVTEPATPVQSITQLGRSASAENCNLNGSGRCDTDYYFSFNKTQSGTTIRASANGKYEDFTGISVKPNSMTKVSVGYGINTAPPAQSVATAFDLTVTPYDAHDNIAVYAGAVQNGGSSCASSNLTLSGSSLNSPSASGGSQANKTPVLPGSTALVGNSWTLTGITLYKAALNDMTYSTCSGAVNVGTPDITVNANVANVNHIYLNSTDSTPSAASHFNGSTIYCNSGSDSNIASPITCNTYAYAFDIYGNNLSGASYSCPSWTFTPTTGHDPADAAGHGFSFSTSANPVNGTLLCTAGGVTASVTLKAKLRKSLSASCGSWACSTDSGQAGKAKAVCTVSNSSGVNGTGAVSFIPSWATGGSLGANNCPSSGGLANSSNCTYEILQSNPGAGSGNIQVTQPASDSTNYGFDLITFNQGVGSPDCTAALSISNGGWSCVGGESRITYTVTNPSGTQSATLNGTTPVSLTGGVTPAYFVSNTCNASSVLAPAGTCSFTVADSGTTAPSSTVYTQGGFFDVSNSVSYPARGNCTDVITFAINNNQSACSGTSPNQSRTVRITVTNPNTAGKQVNFSSTLSTNVNVSGLSVVPTLLGGNCEGANLSSSQSCYFDLQFSNTNLTGAPTGSITIDSQDSGNYMQNLVLSAGTTGGKINFQCP